MWLFKKIYFSLMLKRWCCRQKKLFRSYLLKSYLLNISREMERKAEEQISFQHWQQKDSTITLFKETCNYLIGDWCDDPVVPPDVLEVHPQRLYFAPVFGSSSASTTSSLSVCKPRLVLVTEKQEILKNYIYRQI